MSLLYFLPGLKELGELPDSLGHAFESKPTWSPNQTGPGCVNGVMLAEQGKLGPRGFCYSEHSQKWVHAGEWWVGYDCRDGRPKPASLARKEQLNGLLVELADGQSWMMPALKFVLSEQGWLPALPAAAKLVAPGEWGIGAVFPQYRDLDQLGEQLIHGVLLPQFTDQPPLDTNARLNALVRLLAVNYRLGEHEASLLEILPVVDPPYYRKLDSILEASIDGARARELIAKNLLASAASRSTPGAGGETPTTN